MSFFCRWNLLSCWDLWCNGLRMLLFILYLLTIILVKNWSIIKGCLVLHLWFSSLKLILEAFILTVHDSFNLIYLLCNISGLINDLLEQSLESLSERSLCICQSRLLLDQLSDQRKSSIFNLFTFLGLLVILKLYVPAKSSHIFILTLFEFSKFR